MYQVFSLHILCAKIAPGLMLKSQLNFPGICLCQTPSGSFLLLTRLKNSTYSIYTITGNWLLTKICRIEILNLCGNPTPIHAVSLIIFQPVSSTTSTYVEFGQSTEICSTIFRIRSKQSPATLKLT